jgi:hypothetical protein
VGMFTGEAVTSESPLAGPFYVYPSFADFQISPGDHSVTQPCDKKNRSEISWYLPIKAFPFNLRKKSLRARTPGKTGRALLPHID